MALTLNNFIGFETVGFEEVKGITLSPTITTLSSRTGSQSLSISGASSDLTAVLVSAQASNVTDGGAQYIFGFAFKYRTNPSSSDPIFQVRDSDDAIELSIELDASGQLVLIDAGSTTLDTSFVLQREAWHYIEVYAEIGSDSGV